MNLSPRIVPLCLAAAFAVVVLSELSSSPRAQTVTVERLWGSRIAPGSTATVMTDTTAANNPYFEIHALPADSANGAAVVICPGGGYDHLSGIREGRNVARWFRARGVTGFVLHYRVGNTSGGGYHHPVQMWDAQRAVRWVRANAKRFNVDTARVGILGFSAGGHLASTVATHWDAGNPDSTSQHYYTGTKDSVDGYSSRPAFQVLGYPVINMDSSIAHAGSKKALLGNAPSAILSTYLSNERQVRANTPPAFLVHTQNDATVPIANSRVYADSLQKYGVRRQFRIYPTGTHGFALADGQDGAPSYADVSQWPTHALAWMDSVGMLAKSVGVRDLAPGAKAVKAAKGGLTLQRRGGVVLANPQAGDPRDLRGRSIPAPPALFEEPLPGASK